MFKKLLALFVITCSWGLAVQVFSQADITGTATTVQIHAAAGQARWVQIIAGSNNAAVVRVGAANTSATVGAPVAAGAGFMLPPIPTDSGQPVVGNNYYDLTTLYVYVSTGDTVSVVWGY